MGCILSVQKRPETSVEKPTPKVKKVNEPDKVEIAPLSLELDCGEERSISMTRVLTEELELGQHGFLRTYMRLDADSTTVEWVADSLSKSNVALAVRWELFGAAFEGDNAGAPDRPLVRATLLPMQTLLLGRVRVGVHELLDFRVEADWTAGEADPGYLAQLAARQDSAARLRLGGEKAFVDKEFPPVAASLDSSPAADVAAPVEFAAAKAVFGAELPPLFRGEVSPLDVVHRKDCFAFSSAAAVVAEREALLKRSFVTKINNKNCQYIMRCCVDGEWKAVFLDQYFPAHLKSKKLAFVSTKNGELWAAVLEKMYAKVLGDYERLKRVTVYDAMQDLLGCPISRFFIRTKFDKARLLRELALAKREGRLPAQPVYAVFNYAKNMSLKTGLTTNRAYAVLDFAAQAGGLGAFVQLRNTAPEYPWRGNWAEGCPLWAATPAAAEALRPDFSAGRFWIAFDDFAFVFNEVGFCHELGAAADELRVPLAFKPDGRAQALHFFVPAGAEVRGLALAQRWELPRGAPAQVDVGALVLDFETGAVLDHLLPTQGRAAVRRLALGPGEYLLCPFSSSAGAAEQALTALVSCAGEARVEAQADEPGEEMMWEAMRQFIRGQVARLGGADTNVVRTPAPCGRFVLYKARLGCLYVAALELLQPLVGRSARFKIDCSQSVNLVPADDSFCKVELKIFEVTVEKEDFTVIGKFVAERNQGEAKFECEVELV